MNPNLISSFILIVLGAVIMSVNIKISFNIYKKLKLIPVKRRKSINILCEIHLTLICFFLFGYLLMAFCTIRGRIIIIRLLLTGVILFLGAIFVFIGIIIQSKMLRLIDETYMQTIRSLTRAIEVRDKYTEGHSEHVANLSILICKNLSKKFNMKMIEYAGLLHDVGKIGVPEYILNKPGKLSDSEMNIMRTHAKMSRDIIKPISGFNEISDWILYHHERMDGKGYYHIDADNIPIQSRIIAVADTYSALVTNRPYRNGMEHNKAIRIMKECAGTQLDSGILNTFLNIPVNEVKKCMVKNFNEVAKEIDESLEKFKL